MVGTDATPIKSQHVCFQVGLFSLRLLGTRHWQQEVQKPKRQINISVDSWSAKKVNMSKLPRQRKRKRCERREENALTTDKIPELPCEIEIDLNINKKKVPTAGFDSCNVLALPSKKIKLAPKRARALEKRPFLSKKKRKELEKIVQKKEKKKKRGSLLEALSSLQAPEGVNFASVINHKKKAPPKKEKKPATENMEEDYDEELEEESEEEQMVQAPVAAKVQYLVPKPTMVQNFCQSAIETKPKAAPKVEEVKQIKKVVPAEGKTQKAVFVPVNRSESMQAARMKLPILAEEQSIMETINENPVVVIAGETGSGKTTQVPQFLYEGGYASKGKMICVTEPRRVAAISMASRVAEEMGLSSREVSYLIRFEGNASPSTRILFMTDGVLLREARSDLLLSKYSVIIVDEAHERSLFTDILVGLLSRVVKLRQQKGDPLKLIVMSATLRLEDFTENTRLFKTPPPVIKVDSRQYPVNVHFARETAVDYMSAAYKKVCKIHTQLPDGGILVFVTGQKEVKQLVQKLRKAFPLKTQSELESQEMDSEKEQEEKTPLEFDEIGRKGSNPKKKKKKKKKNNVSLEPVNLDSFAESALDDEAADALECDDDDEDGMDIDDMELPALRQPMWVLPLYSLLPSYKQTRVFLQPPESHRLCVVATNIAETSLTIPGVKYVVDCGRTKLRKCDKITGVSTFHVDWTSKASAEQRKGRAGRVGPGHCYRLYSSAVFNDKLPQFSEPDILSRPVDDLFLQMKAMGIDKVINFPYPKPPSQEQLEAAEVKLVLLGALEPPSEGKKSAGGLTPLGKAISGFPVAPRFGKMLALCMQQKELMPHAVALVAVLSVEQLLLEPGKAVKECALHGQALQLGDPAILLRLLYASGKALARGGEKALSEFCDMHALRLKGMKEVGKLRVQLTSEINLAHPELGLCIDPTLPPPNDSQCRMLRQILLAGSVDQVAMKVDQFELKEKKEKWKLAYRTPLLEQPVFLSGDSALKKAKPQWVIFQELFETGKIMMRGVTVIEPDWLTTYAPSLCRLSPILLDPAPRFDPRSHKLMCWVTGTFGKGNWELPRMEIEIPEGPERYKYLALFIVEGAVFPSLAEFKHQLILNTGAMTKSYSSLAPKYATLVNQLMLKQADSKQKIEQLWKKDPKYLLQAFKQWIPESAHARAETLWPPS
ncbi:Hypothetical predicted protein [Cloeon dipterum]|uniref:RNA helicase n=1 Tax=Cloeon dipterum TaxID=197152 RepID=A0A8S1C637_9INSE|nr:Hypothetical predicted protein [Cloeon dipterum]